MKKRSLHSTLSARWRRNCIVSFSFRLSCQYLNSQTISISAVTFPKSCSTCVRPVWNYWSAKRSCACCCCNCTAHSSFCCNHLDVSFWFVPPLSSDCLWSFLPNLLLTFCPSLFTSASSNSYYGLLVLHLTSGRFSTFLVLFCWSSYKSLSSSKMAEWVCCRSLTQTLLIIGCLRLMSSLYWDCNSQTEHSCLSLATIHYFWINHFISGWFLWISLIFRLFVTAVSEKILSTWKW